MFDCDPKPVSTSKSGPGAGVTAAAMKIAARSAAQIAQALSSVSYALFVCGATILTISAFIEPSKVGIPIIIGYSFILAGIAAFATLVIKMMMTPPQGTTYATSDKLRVGATFFSLILLTSISLSMYSSYKSEIKSGNVPQFSTFSALISLFICMQLYEMYKWVTASGNNGVLKVTSTLNSALLLYKLITYILIICLTISLKYYITDG
jgi:hypothetical protein